MKLNCLSFTKSLIPSFDIFFTLSYMTSFYLRLTFKTTNCSQVQSLIFQQNLFTNYRLFYINLRILKTISVKNIKIEKWKFYIWTLKLPVLMSNNLLTKYTWNVQVNTIATIWAIDHVWTYELLSDSRAMSRDSRLRLCDCIWRITFRFRSTSFMLSFLKQNRLNFQINLKIKNYVE